MNKYSVLFSMLFLTSLANATDISWFDDAEQLPPQVEQIPDQIEQKSPCDQPYVYDKSGVKHVKKECASVVTTTPVLVDACKFGVTTRRMPDKVDTTFDGYAAEITYTCFNGTCEIKKTTHGLDTAEINFFRTDKSFYGPLAMRWIGLSGNLTGVRAVSAENVATFVQGCYGQVLARVTCGKAANQCILTIAVR